LSKRNANYMFRLGRGPGFPFHGRNYLPIEASAAASGQSLPLIVG
jgi:hypothetical protein